MARSPASRRILVTVCALAFAMPASAQVSDDAAMSAPAHIASIDGDATLARDGRAEAATTGVPLVSGDRLRTGRGRVEVIFGDGSVLDVDHFTSIDLLSDNLVRLLEGRVRLAVGGNDRLSYRIDTPSGAVRIEVPGEYRVALIGEGGAYDVELVAIRGVATLVNDFGETEVRAGERALARPSLAPSYAQAYNSARWDAFDQWANDRRSDRLGTTSARYLPDDIHGYAGDFDRYGDWRYEYEYGYVWYPRVHVGWRPYYYGRWSWFTPWGWTWISYDKWWGWPTHHYGRWGYRAGSWFWVPKRHWGAAWVYWGAAPGYIGWCPLGWNNRPIYSIVNIHVNGWHGHNPYTYWTVVPRHALGAGPVTRYAVPRGTLRTAVPRWSVESASAPPGPAAETRTATPIYSAGRSYSSTRSAPPIDTSRAQRSAVPRDAYAGGADMSRPSGARTAAPRTPAPAAPGVVGATREPAARPARPRTAYRDLGPGGLEPSAPAVQPEASRSASEYRSSPARRAPAPIDGPRDSTPRSQRPDARNLAVPRYLPPAGEYRTPSRREPRGDDPSAGMSRSSGGGPDRSIARPRYGPPAASPSPPRPMGAPSRSSPGRMSPPARPGGEGARAPSRSAPGGDSGRAPSRSGDAPRARPRPQTK
jgi:hypothetical protein